MQLCLQVITNRLGLSLAHGGFFLWRPASDILLDGVEFTDAKDRLLGDGAALGGEDVHELSAYMCHAGHFVRFIFADQTVEPGISAGVDLALVAGETTDRVFALTVDGELTPGTGR